MSETTPTSHRMPMIEVAERVFNRTTSTPGLNYARRSEQPYKREVWRRLLKLWNARVWRNGLSILTMPSMNWGFEWALLNSRERPKRINGARLNTRIDCIHLHTQRTYITAVEREPAIYLAGLKMIPGGTRGIAHMQPAPYASRSLKTDLVSRYHLTSVERVLMMATYAWDAVWLDFNGPLTDRRIEAIEHIWQQGLVRRHLAVTALAARQSDRSGIAESLRSVCSDSELLDAFHYQSGHSPMSHIVLGRQQSGGTT